MACCPGCFTLETLWFRGEEMQPTKKFERRENGRVYHDCNLTDKPCRLYLKFARI